MSDRRDPVAPITSISARPSGIDARERAAARTDTSETGEAPSSTPAARIETYRLVIDPETLRAVTEVRDPATNALRFTIPATAKTPDTP